MNCIVGENHLNQQKCISSDSNYFNGLDEEANQGTGRQISNSQ